MWDKEGRKDSKNSASSSPSAQWANGALPCWGYYATRSRTRDFKSEGAGYFHTKSPVVIGWGWVLEGSHSLESQAFCVNGSVCCHGQRKFLCKGMQKMPVEILLVDMKMLGMRVLMAATKHCAGHQSHLYSSSDGGTKGHHSHDWEAYTCLSFPGAWLTVCTRGISGLGMDGWV